MKKLLLPLLVLIFANPASSQTHLFHENFELPFGADSVASAGSPGWNIHTSLAFMGNQSIHSEITPGDTSILTTISFSTTGWFNINLTFHHITKIEFFDRAVIEVSTDSITWIEVTASNSTYLGSGSWSGNNNSFNSASYSDWQAGNNNAIPDSSWWRYEAFDLSFLLANQPDVWIRFKLYDANGNGASGNYGWLIDNITVSDNPGFYYFLGGTLFHDLNGNGILDPGEPPVANQPVLILPHNVTIFTNANGEYYYTVIPGSYQVSYQPLPHWNITTSPAVYNVSVTNQGLGNLDFGLSPDSLFYDITGNLTSGPARCFNKIEYFLNYLNSGTLTSDSVRIIFDADPNLIFNFSSPPPDIIAGNTYTWTQPGPMPLTGGNITLQMNVPLAAGTVITSVMTVTLLDATGNILATDIDTSIKIVTCSWDPNDKSVDPAGVQAQNYTLIGEELEYLIRFQNTGNDTAFKVVIVDTLSMHLDLETFNLISMSHDLTSAVINNGIITFTFEDIYLPDSIVDEPNSHGFIVFSINHNPNLADHTEIENTAYIYFDFNPAVVTNTTLNTMVNQIPVSVPSLLNSEVLQISPNPTTNYLKVDGLKADSYFTIFDFTGREIKSGSIMGGNNLIIVKEINFGAYILRLHSKEMIYSIKFFKIE